MYRERRELKARANELGVTIAHVAREASVGYCHASGIFNGRVGPSVAVARRLAAALRLPIEEAFPDVVEREKIRQRAPSAAAALRTCAPRGER